MSKITYIVYHALLLFLGHEILFQHFLRKPVGKAQLWSFFEYQRTDERNISLHYFQKFGVCMGTMKLRDTEAYAFMNVGIKKEES